VNVSGIHSTSPLWGIDKTPSTAKVGDHGPKASANPAEYLTESDKSFLLNGLGVTITPLSNGSEHGYTLTTSEPVSDDEWVARQTAAAQIMSDRQQGLIQGDVSTTYLTELLTRARDDSSSAFQAVLQRGLDFLAKGAPVTRVDTQA